VFALTDLSDNKIGDHTGEQIVFLVVFFSCFLSLISWVLFSESLGDPD
jgi:hypothetical protein